MIPLTQMAHRVVKTVLAAGDVAIDATAGNGHDTLFLARCVGGLGRVYAFDVQPTAIEQTTALLEQARAEHPELKNGHVHRSGLGEVRLLQRSHAELSAAIDPADRGRVGAIMFNLGYLPGGDKAITTQTETTLRAVQAASIVLRPEGVLTVLAYPGHPAGAEEVTALLELFPQLRRVIQFAEVDLGVKQPEAPRLFVGVKLPSGQKADDAA